ncbi:hypothetical protein Vafri_4210 [Volvox africanus]|uniref:Uncharacterized protein n=1 Tax=Volvox africanus TaxID=51714 RepID=A0A8J4ATN6_9CHLO|nr:hypothetical protein Vafri_4210 [Volvox africanus]
MLRTSATHRRNVRRLDVYLVRGVCVDGHGDAATDAQGQAVCGLNGDDGSRAAAADTTAAAAPRVIDLDTVNLAEQECILAELKHRHRASKQRQQQQHGMSGQKQQPQQRRGKRKSPYSEDDAGRKLGYVFGKGPRLSELRQPVAERPAGTVVTALRSHVSLRPGASLAVKGASGFNLSPGQVQSGAAVSRSERHRSPCRIFSSTPSSNAVGQRGESDWRRHGGGCGDVFIDVIDLSLEEEDDGGDERRAIAIELNGVTGGMPLWEQLGLGGRIVAQSPAGGQAAGSEALTAAMGSTSRLSARQNTGAPPLVPALQSGIRRFFAPVDCASRGVLRSGEGALCVQEA